VNGISAEPIAQALTTSLRQAIARGQQGLFARQQADGHWVGELQGDSILESEYILLMAFLGRESDDRVRQAARYLLKVQMPGGGWGNYPGGPAEISVSVKAYFALKIAGQDTSSVTMTKALAVIRQLGGAEACNSFTKFYLALLGQTPFDNCPAVPPEIVLLPQWFYFNIHAISAWSRTILVPLSIVWAMKPKRELPAELGIAELFLEPPSVIRPPHPPTQTRFTWTNFFLRVDRMLKRLERWRLTPLRPLAVRRSIRWMRERYVDSDGVGAIFPGIVYTAIVLRAQGVPDDDTEMIWAMKQVEDLMIPEEDTLRLQPCLSPVWDTTLTLIALADAGTLPDDPRIVKAVEWLLAREIRRPGDWSISNPKLEPGGWCFEYRNGFYPDTDDTAMALIALARTGHAPSTQAAGAVMRGLRWLVGMQNSDGGWAAFDRDINREILEKVPFADHNAMLDPSCPDITARVLEALGHYGYRPGEPLIDRALRFIQNTQDRNGSWIGRWGVNYIYGTWQVLVGLHGIGADMQSPMVRKAVAWLKSVQQFNGAWGESCRSYDDPSWAGKGDPTASQTAWALLGLQAAGEQNAPEYKAGVRWLLETQNPDGGWTEEPFTGTGFPKVFYLKYHLYSVYFPLMAIARQTPLAASPRAASN